MCSRIDFSNWLGRADFSARAECFFCGKIKKTILRTNNLFWKFYKKNIDLNIPHGIIYLYRIGGDFTHNEVLEDLIVVKRSGQRVPFNASKVAVAIKKAFDITDRYDEKNVFLVFEKVLAYINDNYKDRKTINVEDIQDIVQDVLKQEKYLNIYESFKEYREKQLQQNQEMEDQISDKRSEYKDPFTGKKEKKGQIKKVIGFFLMISNALKSILPWSQTILSFSSR